MVSHPQSISNNLISSILKDDDGFLWIGTMGGGLNKLVIENNNYIFKHFKNSGQSGSLSNNYILTICNDHKGNIWVGTENGGLDFLPSHSDKFITYLAEENKTNCLSRERGRIRYRRIKFKTNQGFDGFYEKRYGRWCHSCGGDLFCR